MKDRNVSRRTFIGSSAVAALGGAAFSLSACSSVSAARTGGSTSASPAPPPEGKIIDTNVYLGRWPFRQLPEGEPAQLVNMLHRHGVQQAWTGSLSGPFYKDVRPLNARLAQKCEQYGDGLLVPFGTVNPNLPDWKEDLRLCDEEHQMPGIRLHPNYHNYALDDPVFADLLEQAAARGMIVQLVPWMRDERHHHTEMPVATTNLEPLPAAARAVPNLPLVLLNGFRAAGVPPSGVLETDNIFFDFAKLDVLLGLRRLLDEVPLRRVLFGSFAPMFYFAHAPLKMQESAVTGAEAQALRRDNAHRLLQRAKS
jgi:predicted TIM-barrel fold metal-dependent hydrolase